MPTLYHAGMEPRSLCMLAKHYTNRATFPVPNPFLKTDMLSMLARLKQSPVPPENILSSACLQTRHRPDADRAIFLAWRVTSVHSALSIAPGAAIGQSLPEHSSRGQVGNYGSGKLGTYKGHSRGWAASWPLRAICPNRQPQTTNTL